MDTYTVSATAGEDLQIRIGSSATPDLILFGPDGSELARNTSYRIGSYLCNSTHNRDLYRPCRRTFRVSDRGVWDHCSEPGEHNPLPYGVETTGTITASGGVDAYSLPATAGDHLFFRMGEHRTSMTRNSFFTVRPELELATNWSPSGYYRAEISLTVPETGTYLLLARSHSINTDPMASSPRE